MQYAGAKSQLAGLQATQLAGCFDIAHNGWPEAGYRANGSHENLGIAPNGWRKAEYHAKWLPRGLRIAPNG
jgi:hypothetical protein